jgi:DNA-binding protein HU-beta
MNKQALIGRIAKDARLSKTAAANALNAALQTIADALKKNQQVTLVGFGTFLTSDRKARMGRDPQTKEPIKIPAKRVPKFRAGKALRAAVAKR